MTTDELQAKFRAVMSVRHPFWSYAFRADGCGVHDDYMDPWVECAWQAFKAAHASRDAEVEALRKDAERYRAFRRAAIREDDSFIERVMLRIPDKDCTESQFNEAIDAAMREESK